MPRPPVRRPLLRLAVSAAAVAALTVAIAPALPSADLRPDYKPAAYAIRGATIVPVEGLTIKDGTVIVRDGVIEAVGPAAEVDIPYDAEVIEAKGNYVYPGFIDLYSTLGQTNAATRSQTGAGRTVPYVDFALPRTPTDNRNGLTPEYQVAAGLELTDSAAEEHRRQGFTGLLIAPGGAIAAGQSALAGTSALPRRETIIRSPVALHIALRSPSGSGLGDDDGDGHDHSHQAMATDTPRPATDPGPTQASPPPATPPPSPTPVPTPAPAPNVRRGPGGGGPIYPTSLMGVVSHLRQAMLDAEHNGALHAYYAEKGGPRPPVDPALDSLLAARHKSLPVWWEANTRDEILRALDLAEEFGTTAVIVGGREAGKVAGRLKACDVPVVLRIDFPDEPKVPTAAEYARKTSEEREDPLAVLSDRARLWKERVATASELHKAGVRFAISGDGLAKFETIHAQVRKLIAAGLPTDAAVAALTRNAASIAGLSKRLGTVECGKLGQLVVLTAEYGDEKAKARYVLADGLKFDLEKGAVAAKKSSGDRGPVAGKAVAVTPTPAGEPVVAEAKTKDDARPKALAAKEASDQAKDAPKVPEAGPKAETGKDSEKARPERSGIEEAARAPKLAATDYATEFDARRKPTLKTGGDVFIQNATILTVTKGTIPKGAILIRGGKIAAVGTNLQPPDGIMVLDANGLVAMPGIIDTHSHMAIAGGVNEMSLSIVPEVRVKDVIRGDDPTIYRALAGGTTTARLLHGSANAIGGQDAVIKLKFGSPARDLLLKDGPQGVKFALGENVTRRVGRFPNTRMGVEAAIERAFLEGKAYRETWKAYEAARVAGKAIAPPRRDLRLDALSGIVDGSIQIHSHCYRSDEILMLLRVAERHGIKVKSLQHVLEGYKVAAEIAAHGASASTFSDWWAYKVEAYDAIPYNASLLTQAGVSVSIKSDSDELVRHLYLEAAKMVRYGGVSETEALAMITINPARELGLDSRIGSIEPGKDADMALFNAHPLDSFARCELALIDGEVRFQRVPGDSRTLPAPRPGDHSRMPSAVNAGQGELVLSWPTDLRGKFALTHTTIQTAAGEPIDDGTIVVDDGTIVAVGGPETAVPAGFRALDLKGLTTWPGLIDAGSSVGLTEIGSLNETHDYADSAQFQPELRSGVALHPDSELIPVTRAAGVLASYAQPSGGSISGQGCVFQLDGWVPSELILRDRVALNISIPAYTPINPDAPARAIAGPGGSANPEEAKRRRQERIDAIKEQFREALAYDKVVAGALAHKAAPPTPDPRLEALVPYAKGEKLVLIGANHRVEILDAIKLARDLKLKAAISGGEEAWKVVDAIKESGLPVILAGTLRIPGEESDPYDSAYASAAELQKAGIPFAIRSTSRGADQATSSRNLPFEAATAVAYGLTPEQAMRALTVGPASILGVGDLIGSIEVGKRANLVITDGHILQPTSQVKAIVVGGAAMAPPTSRHTQLYGKYRGRLDAVQAGRAPLGLDRPDPVKDAPTSPETNAVAPTPAERQ
ncbi:amidohydrolase family protein [Isosphaeraceae bacterium EP7]